MMKKWIVLLIALVVVVFSNSSVCFVQGAEGAEYQEKSVFENGDVMYTTLSISSPFVRSMIKNATKTITYTSSSGELLWEFSLIGRFRVDVVGVTCVSASHSVQIYHSSWKASSASSYADGPNAVGNVAMEKRLLGIRTQEIQRVLNLTCDMNGVIH